MGGRGGVLPAVAVAWGAGDGGAGAAGGRVANYGTAAEVGGICAAASEGRRRGCSWSRGAQLLRLGCGWRRRWMKLDGGGEVVEGCAWSTIYHGGG